MVGTVFIYFIFVDWATFRLVPEDEREAMINEFKTFINDKASAREQQVGDYALYNITGQKSTFYYGTYVQK